MDMTHLAQKNAFLLSQILLIQHSCQLLAVDATLGSSHVSLINTGVAHLINCQALDVNSQDMAEAVILRMDTASEYIMGAASRLPVDSSARAKCILLSRELNMLMDIVEVGYEMVLDIP